MRTLGDEAVGLTHADVDVTDGIGVSRIVREHRAGLGDQHRGVPSR